MNSLFLELGSFEKEVQDKFGNDFSFVFRIYNRFISNVKIQDLRKIFIETFSTQESESIDFFDSLCHIRKYIDWNVHFKVEGDFDRYKFILNFIQETILEICDRFDWPKDGFEDAYLKTINTGFINEYVLISPKTSKDRKHTAMVLVKSKADIVELFLVILNYRDKSVLKSLKLIDLPFYYDCFTDVVQSLHWLDDNEIVLSNIDKEINYRYILGRNELEMFFTPVYLDGDALKNKVKLWNPNLTVEEFQDLACLKK